MKKDELITLGLNEEQAASVLSINGKDIEKLKGTNDTQKSELDTVKTQLAEAGKTIEGFKAMDIDAIRAEADKWKATAERAEQDAAAKIAEVEFNTLLDSTIAAAKGKNTKAIRALLDVDTLKSSKNQTEDAKKALDSLREESGYLFEDTQAPPPYAAGTGGAKVMTDPRSVGGEITQQLFGH